MVFISLLPSLSKASAYESDSERYLPSWVKADPEKLILNEEQALEGNKKEYSNKNVHKYKHKQTYMLREYVDDQTLQKFEEADYLNDIIKKKLNSIRPKKVKLIKLRRAVKKGPEESHNPSAELQKEKHFKSAKTGNLKMNRKKRSEHNKLFRSRLRWEKNNEWKFPVPKDKAMEIYSNGFIKYLSQVKLPGKKHDINELENLYKTYQKIAVPKQISKQENSKTKTKNTASKLEEMAGEAIIKQGGTAKLTNRAGRKVLNAAEPFSNIEEQSENNYLKILEANSKVMPALRKKLSLNTFFGKKVSLYSLTTPNN